MSRSVYSFITKAKANQDLRKPLLSKENKKSEDVEEKKPSVTDVPYVVGTREEILNAIVLNETSLKTIDNLKIEAKGITINKLISESKYADVISLLNIHKDARQGINSKYVMYEGNRILIRDARSQTNHDNTYHDWAIMAVNYVHAANKLLDAHGILKEAFSEKINVKLNDFLSKIQNSQDPEVALGVFINQKLIPEIMDYLATIPNNKLRKQDVKKRLAEIRDFSNFDHQTTTVATRIKSGDQDLYQIDIPLVKAMPRSLKNEYKNIINDHGDTVPWYVNQKPYIKALIKQHAQDILDGKTIPTQLRKYLPGIRNGGEEFLVDMNSEDKKIIQHHYHTGTPAHLLETVEDSQKATNESIQQLGNVTGARHVLVLTLLSPWFTGYGDDAYLVNQVEKAIKTANVSKKDNAVSFHTANLPQNFMRGKLSINQMSGANWLVKLARFERDNCKVDSVERKNLDDLILKFGDLKNGSQPYDPENVNLKLVSVIQQLGHAINVAHEKRTGEANFVAVVTSCQSGKDRAGLARIRTLVDSMVKYFKDKKPVSADVNADQVPPQADVQDIKSDPIDILKKIPIEDALINAGQVPAQAGFQGGTLGAKGIKKDSIYALPNSWVNWKNNLFKNSASYNKGLPKDPGKAKSNRNKKIALAIVGLVVGGLLCATGIGSFAGAPIMIGATAALVGVVGATATSAIFTVGIAAGILAIVKGVADSRSAKKAGDLALRNSKEKKGSSNKIRANMSTLVDHRLAAKISDEKGNSAIVYDTDKETIQRVSSAFEKNFKEMTKEVIDNRRHIDLLNENNPDFDETNKKILYENLDLYKASSDLDTKRDKYLYRCIPFLSDSNSVTDFYSAIFHKKPNDFDALIAKIDVAYPTNGDKGMIPPEIHEIKNKLLKLKDKQKLVDLEKKVEQRSEASSSNTRRPQ